jgi:hypothetical protein
VCIVILHIEVCTITKILLAAVSVAGLLMGAVGTAQAQSRRDGSNRYMTVKNRSEFTAVTIRIRLGGRGRFSHDLLGRYVIDPGQPMEANFDDGCCACLVDVQLSGRPWFFTEATPS